MRILVRASQLRWKWMCTLIATIALASVPSLAVCPSGSDCDPNAGTYLLRTDCTGLANCFDSMSALVGSWTYGIPQLPVPIPLPTNCTPSTCFIGWLWTDRQPSAIDVVTIDVGPGTFGPFICPSSQDRRGHVVLRGAGRDETVLQSSGTGVDTAGVSVYDCDELVISNLRVVGQNYGVRWANSGSATWVSADFVAIGGTSLAAIFGWQDNRVLNAPGDNGEKSTHILHDCRSSAAGTGTSSSGKGHIGYQASWSETYFFGGVIEGGPAKYPRTGWPTAGLVVENGSEFSAFGTRIAAIADKVEPDGSTVYGVRATSGTEGSKVLLEGSSVFVRTKTGNQAVATSAADGSIIRSISTSEDAKTF